MQRYVLLLIGSVVVAAATLDPQGLSAVGVPCPVNATASQPFLTCPVGSSCCKARFWGYNVCGDLHCNVCAECCHDALKNASECNACVAASCPPNSYGQEGCTLGKNPPPSGGDPEGFDGCCPGGQYNMSADNSSLPNCLLIGDSVAHGTYPLVKEMLKGVCIVANIEAVDAYFEDRCFWSTSSSADTGAPIRWDVIHYNEGLHSLWPRINTSAEQAAWAVQLGNFTNTLKATGATLVYATMTPFMPEKYLNPNIPGPLNPRNDVETKNALAVKTVQEHGVGVIDDLYSAITAVCGTVYVNCSLCDDESAYHPQGKCGFHYSQSGWELLAKQTVDHIKTALSQRQQKEL